MPFTSTAVFEWNRQWQLDSDPKPRLTSAIVIEWQLDTKQNSSLCKRSRDRSVCSHCLPAVPNRGRSKRGRMQKHANESNRVQISAKERKLKSAKECKHESAKERKRVRKGTGAPIRFETTRFGNFRDCQRSAAAVGGALRSAHLEITGLRLESRTP